LEGGKNGIGCGADGGLKPVLLISRRNVVILELKAKLDGLATERTARLRALAKPVSESQQRLTYLEQFRIDEAGLFNIGGARIAVLRSWGVETAAEIDERKISSIPGFGRNLTERLVNWREGLEQRFHFEPAVVADPRDVQRLDRELGARRTSYMKELRAAIIALERRIGEFEDERCKLWQCVATAFNDRMLVRHNAKASRGR